MVNNLIYGLSCPNTGQFYYVGKSTQGLSRPFSHITSSHNTELKKWIKGLAPHEPVISILEKNFDENEINIKEAEWINKIKGRGAPLFNIQIPKTVETKYNDLAIGQYVKIKRKETKLTQAEFAEKAGVGLRFLRELEQGKDTMTLKRVLIVLKMFGSTLIPAIESKYYTLP